MSRLLSLINVALVWHASSVRNLRSSGSGQTPLGATQYYGIVHIGTPAQEFKVVFDTGSSQLVLASSTCEDDACLKHKRFTAENSTSAIQVGWADDPLKPAADGDDRDTKSISLLGADVVGEYVRDKMCVGGKAQVCGSLDFVVLTEEPDDPFANLDFDGVMGMALVDQDAKEFNVETALLGAQATDKQAFAMYLAPAAAGAVSGGEMHLGGYRVDHLASALVWAPISGKGNWQIKLDDITLGGKSTGLCGKKGCQASVDTGSSLVLAPGQILHQATQAFQGGDECSGGFPGLGFVISGTRFELDSADYVEHDEDGCRLLLTSLTGAAKGGPQVVLGYPFLRKYYSVFDVGHARVGFAPSKHAPKGEASDGTVTVQLTGLRP